MGQRLQLQADLAALLGTAHVYFQPPNNVQMKYPSIVYKLDDIETAFADNAPYRNTKRYQVTVIDPDPDSLVPDKVAQLPLCGFERFFTADNLNHFVYNIFF